MPRRSRIDAPGALHHIMVRGIERGKVFRGDADRNRFLERLGGILQDTRTPCYAWALIPNHFHLLLRSGSVPVSMVMRRLLTGYALWFNRSHNRHGHLFQNRFKSILCQENPYFLELVRYIHLNPIRAHLVEDLDRLEQYPYSGHSALMGAVKIPWQDTQWVLGMFGEKLNSARRAYKTFVQKGVAQGRRPDLTGGGLLRSAGGWEGVKALREEKIHQRNDERMLGDGDFVERVLASAEEAMERRYALLGRGVDLSFIASRVFGSFGCEIGGGVGAREVPADCGGSEPAMLLGGEGIGDDHVFPSSQTEALHSLGKRFCCSWSEDCGGKRLPAAEGNLKS